MATITIHPATYAKPNEMCCGTLKDAIRLATPSGIRWNEGFGYAEVKAYYWVPMYHCPFCGEKLEFQKARSG